MPGFGLLSDLLGYTSIACWLGAQFPQVLENIRRQSCAGLALPFLANWFLGDFSNLIGCILTHQLPFQRWLATYFVCIDLVLVIQYLYYQRPTKPQPLTATTLYPHHSSSAVRRLSVDRNTTRYRTLSAVAANVAAAAALAAQQDGETARHGRHESDLIFRPDGSGSLTSHIPLAREHRRDEDGESDEEAVAALADSFHSEGGRDIGRKRVSWSIERHRIRAGSTSRLSAIASSVVSPSGVDLDGVRRGRSLGRDPEDIEDAVAAEALSPPLTFTNRRNSRAIKKSATMVFLGVWALFGVGTLVGTRRGLPVKNSSVGRVLSGDPTSNSSDIPIALTTTIPAARPSNTVNVVLEMPSALEDEDPLPVDPAPPPHEHQPTAPSMERVLGRIFAWLCTTLYLTSRLPQIWKNFVRKSVEGLSMYLFVFAFLGNVFYVASILFSPSMYLPPPQSTAFLKESIPYLLGSGGTLMFDVTIVTQSFIYKPKHKKRYATRSRNVEERAGLLAGDALARHHYPHHHHTFPHQPHMSSTDGGIVEDGVTRGRTAQIVRSVSG
ncbi:hypothetical protein P691DRAFT_717044 [Macrolepiota fuliginosa MF-IS2]|uniref:PQ-loop-domain-containing protein n=1 Tax=Macrolepiota fuliginosa MF-IS2 TaxID=1400762 RepID=A0A9P6CAX8_9AGAR|nr:hypothetical protein P691DRAFT_717044 [Macrolepiota fuliginosa MF-IS2]